MSRSIAVIGEVFSPNLGDGVIADSMHLLVERAGAHPVHVDLSGKTQWSDEYTPSTKRMTPALHRAARALIPGTLRGKLREREWLNNNHHDLASRVAQASQDCDAAILGGGQLLMDNMLRFPMKIRSATLGLEQAGIKKLAVLACGVGHTWSPRGKQILAQALDPVDLVWLGVRDPVSLDVIKRVLPMHAGKAHWSTDVALWSDEAYNKQPAALDADRTSVGIGIINPRSALAKIVDDNDPAVTGLIDTWRETVTALSAKGHAVTLFSNGDPDDHAFAERIARACDGAAALNERPTRPEELVDQISQFGSVIAHRLHAIIISYALRIPALPLVWDKKVKGFAEITDRADLYLSRERQTSELIAEHHARLIAQPFNDETRTGHRTRTAEHVAQAIELLTT